MTMFPPAPPSAGGLADVLWSVALVVVVAAKRPVTALPPAVLLKPAG